MPLTGTFLRTLDEKRRLAVPKRLRDDFGQADIEFLYIAPGTDRSLLVFSPQGFADYGAKLGPQIQFQNYRRMFYSTAERVDFDGQGRIRIPDRLADYAGLQHEAYLLGVQDHAELWDKTTWDEFSQKLTPEFDELARAALTAL